VRASPLAAFGGLQLILVGDVGQLPPVRRADEGLPSLPITFGFEALSLVRNLPPVEVIVLTTSFRHADDAPFAALLERARSGAPTPADHETLRGRVCAPGPGATRLLSRVRDVDAENTRALESLVARGAEVRTYTASVEVVMRRDAAPDAETTLRTLAAALRSPSSHAAVPPSLRVAVGAEVMLAANVDVAGGLVSGRRARVVGFELGIPRVMLLDGPDLGRLVDVARHTWTQRYDAVGEVRYEQIPLRLAWASTIHRIQGQTLPSGIYASMRSIFAPGQAYTALSRAPSLDKVWLSDYAPSAITAHPAVSALLASGSALPICNPEGWPEEARAYLDECRRLGSVRPRVGGARAPRAKFARRR
jgi:ATP-dependent DNA helicase PIF1